MIREFASLYELFEAIPDEQAAIDHFRAIRWNNREFCPYCGNSKIYHFADRRSHKCGACRKRFSIRVGTIFEDSKIEMRKWIAAIWLITSHRKGIASTQLARDLHVTQKTAWFMLHRLRHAARTRSFNRSLKGTVEADTTFVGGRERNKHEHKPKAGSQGGANKEVVLGIIERGGEVRAIHVGDKAKGLKAMVAAHVEPGATIMTDEDRAFHGLDRKFHHHAVNHSAGEYVRHYTIHVNTTEGVWSILKRQIYGIHHWVSPRHLAQYVAEVVWRYNRRMVKDGNRVSEFLSRVDGRLTYNALIGAS